MKILGEESFLVQEAPDERRQRKREREQSPVGTESERHPNEEHLTAANRNQVFGAGDSRVDDAGRASVDDARHDVAAVVLEDTIESSVAPPSCARRAARRPFLYRTDMRDTGSRFASALINSPAYGGFRDVASRRSNSILQLPPVYGRFRTNAR